MVAYTCTNVVHKLFSSMLGGTLCGTLYGPLEPFLWPDILNGAQLRLHGNGKPQAGDQVVPEGVPTPTRLLSSPH